MAPRLRLVPALGDTGHVRPAPLPIRVVLSDDHEAMRRSLRGLLEAEDDIEVLAEADNLESVEHEVRLSRPDVLVLDLGTHDGAAGIESIGRLGELGPETTIVGLTMQDDPAFAQHALTAGATGFVCKDMADVELVPAIRAAARGEQFVSARITERLDARGNGLQSARYGTAAEETVLQSS